MVGAPLSETDLVRACLALLMLRRVFAWRNNTGGIKVGERFIHMGIKGASDIVGVLPGGRFLAVECKRPGNRLTEEQRRFGQRVTEQGGLALVVWSAQQLERELDTARKKD